MKTEPRIKLPHPVIVRSPGLLPMRYTVRELAEELGAPERTLRDWLVAGVPHQRDVRGHIWIVGTEFAGWVQQVRQARASRPSMKENEAYCFRCKATVLLQNPTHMPVQGKLVHLSGECPHCGTTVKRGSRLKG
jgi:hypothetical protein